MKAFIALFIYRTLLIILLPITVLLLLFISRKKPDFRYRLNERLGFIPNSFRPGGIIIHAASVGEVLALKTFIEKALSENPLLPITVTTFTPTGSAQVTKLFSNKVQHCYLPIDNFFCNALFLAKLKPTAMVFMETELWPSIIHQAKTNKCHLMLINARLTDKSVKQYQKLSWLIKPTLACFDALLCQSKDNFQRFVDIGAPIGKCHTSGNLKYDIRITDEINIKQKQLSPFVYDKKLRWVVASTHPGDEELAIKAFKKLLLTYPQLLLIIVPRHPERFDSVYKTLLEHNLSAVKRSDKIELTDRNQVWLLDSLGELMPMYGLATLVTMGGSFSAVGGHNPLEPALFKKAVITGPNMSNFAEVTEKMNNKNAIMQLPATTTKNDTLVDALANAVSLLLSNSQQRKTLGENSYQVVLENQGATATTIATLQALIGTTTIAAEKSIDNGK